MDRQRQVLTKRNDDEYYPQCNLQDNAFAEGKERGCRALHRPFFFNRNRGAPYRRRQRHYGIGMAGLAKLVQGSLLGE